MTECSAHPSTDWYSSRSPFLSLRAAVSFYLQLIFASFTLPSSPWIFILLLTPLNVNSSFPGLFLFISVAWWFDHAENTRLAITQRPSIPPQGHLLSPKCYCLCILTLRWLENSVWASFWFFFTDSEHNKACPWAASVCCFYLSGITRWLFFFFFFSRRERDRSSVTQLWRIGTHLFRIAGADEVTRTRVPEVCLIRWLAPVMSSLGEIITCCWRLDELEGVLHFGSVSIPT